MGYRILADVLLVLHLGFIAYVVAGGFLSLRWPRNAWVHLPCAAWGALIEFTGWICPLTPLEQRWRILGGQESYQESFIEHYLLPLVYPAGLTRSSQFWLGAAVIVLNLAIYALVIRRHRRRRRADRAGAS